MNLSSLWEAWPMKGPWHLSPLSGGTNNHILRADAADGQRYVLRVSTEMSNIPRVRYEAALLEAVSRLQPPFLLPLPLRSLDGDIIVPFEREDGSSSFAILAPLLPGSLVENRSDLVIASHAGHALAWLDNALATLPEMRVSGKVPLRPVFGELEHCHLLVPDPLASVEQLPVEQEHKRQIRHLLITVMERVAGLYSQLPQELLHRDFDPSNILVEHQQVTAVLDFEFAGPDLRVLDVCVALSWWPVNVLGTGKEWGIIDAFGSAYVKHFPLAEQEILAFPDIWRLRDATSFVHRMGRYFAGLETETRMQARVRHSLWREEWLSAHQETLVQHALAWTEGLNP